MCARTPTRACVYVCVRLHVRVCVCVCFLFRSFKDESRMNCFTLFVTPYAIAVVHLLQVAQSCDKVFPRQSYLHINAFRSCVQAVRWSQVFNERVICLALFRRSRFESVYLYSFF